MTEVRRPISLQLGVIEPRDMMPSLPEPTSSPPTRPTRPRTMTTNSSTNDSNKRAAREPRKKLTASFSSGSLASLSSSTGSSLSSSHCSSSPRPRGVESSELESPSLILPYLYVGDQTQTKIDTISNLNISYILSLQSLPKFLDSDIELEESCTDEKAPCTSTGLQKEMRPDVSSQVAVRAEATSSHSPSSAHPPQRPTTIISPVTSGRETETMSIGQQPPAGCSGCKPTSSSTKMGCQEELSSELVAKELLPSINSSKDYLVKFRSCVNRLIRGKCINISDTFEQYVERFFDETHNFIEEARRNRCNILVHCKAGISRSPTIAIAYLMKWKRLHLQDAYDFVKRCRPQISPNLNFMGQLMNYERLLIQRGLHKPPLPSPVTSCLRSHSYQEQVSSSATFVLAYDEQHHQTARSGDLSGSTSRTNESTRNEDLIR